MKTTTRSTHETSTVLIIAGVLVGLYIVAVLVGISLPFISGYRAAFIVLAVFGIAACAVGGIGHSFRVYGWRNPMSIVSYVLGALALVLIGGVLLNIPLPLIHSDYDAFVVLSALILGKVVLTWLHSFLASMWKR